MDTTQFLEKLDDRLRKIEGKVTEVSTKIDNLIGWMECRDRECKDIEGVVNRLTISNAKHGVYVTLISILASTFLAASFTYYFNKKLLDEREREVAHVERK